MTARDASGVPAGLRELLEVLAELAEILPVPADHNWDRRGDLEIRRHSMLSSRLEMLVDQIKSGDEYPGVAADLLTSYCQRSVKAVRAELAKPLGYEPEPGQDGAK